MKNKMTGLFSFMVIAGCLLSSSCKFGLEVTQRKYRPGFQVGWSGPVKHFGVRRDLARKSLPVKMEKNKTIKFFPTVKKNETIQTDSNRISKPSTKAICAKAVHQEEMQGVLEKENQISEVSCTPPSKPKDKKSFYFLSGFTALLTAGLAFAQRKRLSKISRWSARHAVLSRWVQAAGHLVLSAGAFHTGGILYKYGVTAGPALIPVSAGAFILTAMFYRGGRKNAPITPSYFMKAKMADLTLILSTTILWASAGNHLAVTSRSNNSGNSNAVVWQSIASLSGEEDHAEFLNPMNDSQKGISGGQVFGIIVVVFAYILTILLLAGLACSIYCSGNITAAILVSAFGLLLFTSALIGSIKAIVPKDKELKPKTIH